MFQKLAKTTQTLTMIGMLLVPALGGSVHAQPAHPELPGGRFGETVRENPCLAAASGLADSFYTLFCLLADMPR